MIEFLGFVLGFLGSAVFWLVVTLASLAAVLLGIGAVSALVDWITHQRRLATGWYESGWVAGWDGLEVRDGWLRGKHGLLVTKERLAVWGDPDAPLYRVEAITGKPEPLGDYWRVTRGRIAEIIPPAGRYGPRGTEVFAVLEAARSKISVENIAQADATQLPDRPGGDDPIAGAIRWAAHELLRKRALAEAPEALEASDWDRSYYLRDPAWKDASRIVAATAIDAAGLLPDEHRAAVSRAWNRLLGGKHAATTRSRRSTAPRQRRSRTGRAVAEG